LATPTVETADCGGIRQIAIRLPSRGWSPVVQSVETGGRM